MSIIFDTLVNDKRIVVIVNNNKLEINDNIINLPCNVGSVCVGKDRIYILLRSDDFHKAPKYNILIYDFDGNYLYNIEKLGAKSNDFYYTRIHNAKTLKQGTPFANLELDDSHEYLMCYDGSCENLFDVTENIFIDDVFTH